ncbi:response regulator transcription factor [Alkalimarinus alittae]|uniref:Response regulator transcription factor n=1 Tax=Alkalimarinus alittae TaxID=2961619 RepID=A0ABY6N504_9ALTE|nr:response regulator transcription factor [Alkalimarinus alittae]UZE97067.1 response regulator transcription factor [Alkalimarinus alittae]
MIETKLSARILIIEDDNTLNRQVAELLIEKGHSIDQCYDGNNGLIAAVRQPFDLILLDVLLPGIDGFTLLNTFRKTHQTPVMMLTACGAEEERITGYSKGADDYLSKPFNTTELLLRIDALLRRTLKSKDSSTTRCELTIDSLHLNRQHLSVSVKEHPITMTPIQFKLLWMLATHQNEVLSKPYLYQLVLEREFSPYDRSLDMHLSRVRRKLTQAGIAADRLQTVHGKGYSFV